LNKSDMADPTSVHVHFAGANGDGEVDSVVIAYRFVRSTQKHQKVLSFSRPPVRGTVPAPALAEPAPARSRRGLRAAVSDHQSFRYSGTQCAEE
jgi:hypothetical protein